MSDHYELLDNTGKQHLGFSPDRLPSWADRYLSVQLEKGGRHPVATTGPYVGAIPLSGDGTLYLLPRAGRIAFTRMILVADGLDDAYVEDAEVDYQASDSGYSWLRLLARPFVRRLRHIERESLSFTREGRTERLTRVRGRVLPLPTALAIARRSSRPVVTDYRIRSYHTPEHRMLATAAARLLRDGLVIDRVDRETAIRWANRFGNGAATEADRLRVVARLRTNGYEGPRDYYGPTLVLANLILTQTGLGRNAADSVRAGSVMLNVNTLFERYVRRLLGLALDGFQVGKAKATVGDLEPLYQDGAVLMDPDVVVVGPDQRRVIIDAKYKPGGFTAENHYQMSAYLRGYGAPVGILVRPDFGGGSAARSLRSTKDGQRVIELTVSLDRPVEAERLLVHTVRAAHRLARFGHRF